MNTVSGFLVLCLFALERRLTSLCWELCKSLLDVLVMLCDCTAALMRRHEQVFCERVCILGAGAISVQVNHNTRVWRLGLNIKLTDPGVCEYFLWWTVCCASDRMYDFMRARGIIYEQKVSSVCPSTAVLSAPLHPHCPVLVLHGKVHQYFGWPPT